MNNTSHPIEFAIRGNKVLTSDGIRKAVVLVKDGLIADILSEVPGDFSAEVFDIQDSVLMPGLIDPHVHINEPGRTDWEGFDTATRAAITGGLTSLVDMPLNSSPVTTTAEAFDRKIAATSGQLHTNVGFWGDSFPAIRTILSDLLRKVFWGLKPS